MIASADPLWQRLLPVLPLLGLLLCTGCSRPTYLLLDIDVDRPDRDVVVSRITVRLDLDGDLSDTLSFERLDGEPLPTDLIVTFEDGLLGERMTVRVEGFDREQASVGSDRAEVTLKAGENPVEIRLRSDGGPDLDGGPDADGAADGDGGPDADRTGDGGDLPDRQVPDGPPTDADGGPDLPPGECPDLEVDRPPMLGFFVFGNLCCPAPCSNDFADSASWASDVPPNSEARPAVDRLELRVGIGSAQPVRLYSVPPFDLTDGDVQLKVLSTQVMPAPDIAFAELYTDPLHGLRMEASFTPTGTTVRCLTIDGTPIGSPRNFPVPPEDPVPIAYLRFHLDPAAGRVECMAASDANPVFQTLASAVFGPGSLVLRLGVDSN